MALNNREIKDAIKAGKRVELRDDGVPGLHALVTPAGAATFYIRYVAAAGHRRYKLGRFGEITTDQARKLARIKLGEVAEGGDPQGDKIRERIGRAERVSLDDAVATYLESAGHRLRPKTLATYGEALARFQQWARRARVRTLEDLDRARLSDFRRWLVALPKRIAKQGGRRGKKAATAERRGPLAVNRELRAVKTFLLERRIAGALPNADREALQACLHALPAPREAPVHLSPGQIETLLRAALRHDADTFAETRAEHAGNGRPGTTPRYRPIAPFAAVLLLTGMRRGEALGLRWSDVELDALDHDGRKVGEIRLRADATKTHRARTIGLEVSPGVRRLLAAMKLRATGERVFEGYTATLVDSTRRRLLASYGAPVFDWQALRSTCGTYLTCAPAIFGGAAPFMSAKQLGHSVVVAERHYAGQLRGIPHDARNLDAAMRIEDVLAEVVEGTEAVATVTRLPSRGQR